MVDPKPPGDPDLDMTARLPSPIEQRTLARLFSGGTIVLPDDMSGYRAPAARALREWGTAGTASPSGDSRMTDEIAAIRERHERLMALGEDKFAFMGWDSLQEAVLRIARDDCATLLARLAEVERERDAGIDVLCRLQVRLAEKDAVLERMRSAARFLRDEIVATEQHGDGAADDHCPVCAAIAEVNMALAALTGTGGENA